MVDSLRIDHEPAARGGLPGDGPRARGSLWITRGLTTSLRLMVDYLTIAHEPAAHGGLPEDSPRARGSWWITWGLTTSPQLIVDYLRIDHEPLLMVDCRWIGHEPAAHRGLPED